LINRADFIARIAAAIMRGRNKVGMAIPPEDAERRAHEVADALPTLFREETIELAKARSRASSP
jgi:hypothetical protein